MKKSTLWAFASLFYLLGFAPLLAQEYNPENLEVKKHTLMERFEPGLVLTVDERMLLKEKRKNTMKRRKRILDTMDISERRRQRLMKVLLKNPFSDQLNRAMADIEFEEDHVDD